MSLFWLGLLFIIVALYFWVRYNYYIKVSKMLRTGGLGRYTITKLEEPDDKEYNFIEARNNRTAFLEMYEVYQRRGSAMYVHYGRMSFPIDGGDYLQYTNKGKYLINAKIDGRTYNYLPISGNISVINGPELYLNNPNDYASFQTETGIASRYLRPVPHLVRATSLDHNNVYIIKYIGRPKIAILANNRVDAIHKFCNSQYVNNWW